MIGTRIVGLVVLASSLVSSYAACHNNCNGHGTCGAHDRCTCHHAWAYAKAEDCSKRLCPYGEAWSMISSSAHSYAECSNRGACNRETGECECIEGFNGHACQRSSCPADCSGHGQCGTLQLWTSLDTDISTTYAEWDAEKIMVCKCDPGYEGPDCAARMCPLGDDPLSTGQEDEVHTIVLGGTTMAGTFVLEFTDWTGQVHLTRPLPLATVTALSVQEALVALPNNVIPSVTAVVSTSAGVATDLTIAVTFTASENSGGQTKLELLYSGGTAHGLQPVFALSGSSITSATTVTVANSGELAEGKVCAGRGTCDSETGLCACHTGFYGHSCDKQTALQ